MENNKEMINQVESAPEMTVEENNNESSSSKKPFPWWIIAVCAVVVIAAVIALVFLIPGGGSLNAEYRISVVDEIGNPVGGVMVKLVDSNGNQRINISEKDGTVSFADMPKGTYTVVVDKAATQVKILQSEYILDNNSTELKVVVRDETKCQPIYGAVDDGALAYTGSVGTYVIPARKEEMTYLVFAASVKGNYSVSITSDDASATVGYYGIPMFVQSTHRIDGEYDGKSFSLSIYDTATPFVFGVKGSADVTLTIERTGDAPFNPDYEPSTVVSAKEEFKSFTTGTLVPVDITDSSIDLHLGDDGYYYIGAKRVYIRIKSTSQYLDASLSFIAGLEENFGGQNIGGDVYDENGNFVAKYSFNTMIGQYAEHCDANGVYPLTEEMAQAIKLHGESAGWWKPNTVNFLFEGVPFNEKYAWLFLCCTEQ